MDRKFRVFLSDGADESTRHTERKLLFSDKGMMVPSQFRCLGLEKASHVLHTEDVDAFLNTLFDEVKVVLEGIFSFLGAGHIAGVANNGLDNTSCFLCGIDAKSHLYDLLVYLRPGLTRKNLHFLD